MAFVTILAIPVAFTSARVAALYKGKGSALDPKNYRPISLLGSITKVFDRILYNKLLVLIEEKLCEQQHGFRKKRSTDTALNVFNDYIFTNTDKPNEKVVATFIDMKKAFGTVSPDILIEKLIENFAIEKKLLAILYLFFNGKIFQNRW